MCTRVYMYVCRDGIDNIRCVAEDTECAYVLEVLLAQWHNGTHFTGTNSCICLNAVYCIQFLQVYILYMYLYMK